MALTQRQVRDPRKLAPILDELIDSVSAESDAAAQSLTDDVVIALTSGETIAISVAAGRITGITYDDGEG